MRRILPILLLIMIHMFPIKANASNSHAYQLKDLHMTLEMPDNWTTFTPSVEPPTKSKDPNKANDILEVLYRNYIYLNSNIYNPLSEINIAMLPSPDYYTINEIEEEDLASMVKNSIREIAKTTGTQYYNYSTYKHNQTKFVVMDFERNELNIKVAGRVYFTIINGQAISITLSTYTGQLTNSLTEIHKNVVDSITFQIIPKPHILQPLIPISIVMGAIGFIAKKLIYG